MKTRSLLKPLLAVLLLALLPQVASAYDFKVGGLCYNRNSDGTSVTVTSQFYPSRPRYADLSGDLVIPATVTYSGKTYSVTTIGEYAFEYCNDLTSVTIPNSVTTIGEDAFDDTAWYDNQPDGLVYAGLNAYKYKGTMPNGTCIVIQEGTKSISPSCFLYRSEMMSAAIPNSVTSIGLCAFRGCSGLESIVVAAGNSTYDSRDNCNAIIETATNTLIAGCKTTTIPNSVTSIGNWAFADCRSLTSVTIPNSVTSIGSYAFSGCI